MNILLVSHGQLCQGVNDAFHMFAPTATCVHAVSLTNDGGIDAFRAALDAKLAELRAQGDVLILADLKGGTPYNESYVRFMQDPEHLRLAAGLNLPMLIEAGVLVMSGGANDAADADAATAHAALDAAYQAALKAGSEGITGTELPDESSDDEDDLF